MNIHHTLHLKTFNAHAVLPRILLGFSRRRLRILALQFFDVFENGFADLQIDFDAEASAVAEVVKQLEKIVEVESVRSESRAPLARPSDSENAQAAA